MATGLRRAGSRRIVVRTMRSRFSFVVWAVLLAVGSGGTLAAQDTAGAAAPLLAGQSVPPGRTLLTAASARNALELGFPSLAAELYRAMIEAPQPPAGDLNQLVLEWVTALLDDGRATEAEAALKRYVGLPTASYRLRAGLVAAALRRPEEARAEADAVQVEDLPAGDRSWYHYLVGLNASTAGDFARANNAYDQAITLASSELSRARFVLARVRALLNVGELSDADLATLRRNVEQYQGRSTGYRFAEQYAAALHQRGRRDEAVRFLQEQLQALPPQEREVHDDFRLDLGLIAGAQDGVGRNALNGLLAAAADRDKQRIALQLLSRASTEEAPRAAFRRTLNELTAVEPAHPILEDLLIVRAQLSLAENRYADAEADANTVLQLFPGSQLKPAALGVLMGSAWERGQFRRAAGYATQARDEPSAGAARAALGVLVAEAYFRAPDYRSAADAYAAALTDVPVGIAPGALMFQRVLSEINADRLSEAEAQLDLMGLDPRFDTENRWRTEWNLGRALQTAGDDGVARAYARVNRLLAGDATTLPVELRVRMAWFQARLAYETGDAEQTLILTARLREGLGEVDAVLRADVVSSLALLEAQADFRLNRPDAALEVLKRLRADYPRADASVYSFIIEAEAYAAQGQFVEAQRVYVKLADDYPQNRFAPYALFQAALNVERRGQAEFLEEAIRLIERLVQAYPTSDLVFMARFKQGDLLRRLNQFGAAQQVYELLVRDFARHPDVRAAELALADCHAAQAATDASHLESAIAIYERLQDQVAADLDLRVESGFKHGHALVRTSKIDRAQEVWWPVVNAYLLNETEARRLGANGRHWMARILVELASLHEQQGKLEQARDLYELAVKSGLPYGEAVRSRLARLRGGEVAPNR